MNRVLNDTIMGIRCSALEKAKGKDRAVFWREKDLLEGRIVETGVIILPTMGCSWGTKSGCSMCGYVYDSSKSISQEGILDQFNGALKKLGDIEYLKIFNSGSFFDVRELEPQTIRNIMEEVNNQGKIRRLQVESRPEFVKNDIVKEVNDLLKGELEVGIGLETSSDFIRENSINKGFSLNDHIKAQDICTKNRVQVKAYLMIKPPFLTEMEAIEDAVTSGIEAAKLGAAKISYNPMNIQRGTLVELLFNRREYRPPWLWSVVEVLKRVKEKVDIPVLCYPTAGGKSRGAHNCAQCDEEVLKAILDFSLEQDMKVFDSLDCSCKEEWEIFLETESMDN